MSDKKGVIYILTNPSFPDYVKIGYADDIDKRFLSKNIPFIDTGIDLSCINKKIGGLVRTTTILPDNDQKKAPFND